MTADHETSMEVLDVGGSSREIVVGGFGKSAANARRYGDTSAKFESSMPLRASTRYLQLGGLGFIGEVAGAMGHRYAVLSMQLWVSGSRLFSYWPFGCKQNTSPNM
jgi:hypothetical protein